MVQPYQTLTAVAAPLAKANVDTEVIIPIRRLIDVARGQLGPYAFEPWRYNEAHQPNGDFVLNQAKYADARILVAGENFGCGSSREHAVWALWDMGFRCIIAPSFGDIFRANSFQIGLLTIVLDQHENQRLMDEIVAAPRPVMTVDLNACLISTPESRTLQFSIDKQRRAALLEGLDEIGLTLKHSNAIARFAAADQKARPWVYQKLDSHKMNN